MEDPSGVNWIDVNMVWLSGRKPKKGEAEREILLKSKQLVVFQGVEGLPDLQKVMQLQHELHSLLE